MRSAYVGGHRHGCLSLLVAVIVASRAARAASDDEAAPGRERWSAQVSWEWYRGQPWLVGFNYIPANSINTIEVWQKETFVPVTIDPELALAHGIGLNCARVFVQYLVWENDPEGLKQRIDTFFGIAAKHGIKTMFVLFDGCAFGITGPFLGKQPGVVPGEYANGWTPSPGPSRVVNREAWPKFQAYVKDSIGRFRSDQRVLAWDIYNEPGNANMGYKSLPLLRSGFVWARHAAHTQPKTAAGLWPRPKFQDFTEITLSQSDILSIHLYDGSDAMRIKIKELQREGDR